MCKLGLKIGTIDGKEHIVNFEVNGTKIEDVINVIYGENKKENDLVFTVFKIEGKEKEFIVLERKQIAWIKYITD